MSKEKAYRVPGIMNCEGKGYHLEGPGTEFGYHGGYLWPNFSLPTEEQAEQICKMVNVAYEAGYEKAQRDIRKALGVS